MERRDEIWRYTVGLALQKKANLGKLKAFEAGERSRSETASIVTGKF